MKEYKKYIIDRAYLASMGIANAVLVALGMGLLLQTIGQMLHWDALIQIGAIGKVLLIPAIGIGIAICLRANTLVILSAGAAAVIGGKAVLPLENGGFAIVGGEPIGAILAAVIAIWVGKRLSGKTNFDMILIPAASLLSGGFSGLLFAKIMTPILVTASASITSLVADSPLLSSMIIALVFALLILSPASSAALAIALQLDPTASAAALIGCSVQFVSFAVLGLKDNDSGAFFAQMICTPKLQTPNIIRKPSLTMIPLLTAMIAGPIGVLFFELQASPEVAGMGFCALVAPLYLIANHGWIALGKFLLVALILPAIIALIARPLLQKFNLLKQGDLVVKLQ